MCGHPWQLAFGCFFVLLAMVGLGYDFWLVESGKRSISAWVWAKTAAHPIIMVFGCFAFLGIAYLVRDEWIIVCLTGLLAGHLFAHA